MQCAAFYFNLTFCTTTLIQFNSPNKLSANEFKELIKQLSVPRYLLEAPVPTSAASLRDNNKRSCVQEIS